jgi:hypothetical protein
VTTFPVYKTQRLAELISEPWGDLRIPDLQEVYEGVRPRRVLEIGCYIGVSTEFWLLHCEQVIAVDPWPIPEVRRAFLNRCGHYPNLTRLQGKSPEAFICRKDFHSLDMVYVDGDHSYAAVLNDIYATAPMLRMGGTMAGHDYYLPDVRRAVHEVFSGGPDAVYSDGSWSVRVLFPEELKNDLTV